MTELRYMITFDKRIVAVDMDLQTALILSEALAEKFYESMKYGANIVISVFDYGEVIDETD